MLLNVCKPVTYKCSRDICVHLLLTLGSNIFDQLSSDDDPFDTEDDDDEGEDIIEYQGVS